MPVNNIEQHDSFSQKGIEIFSVQQIIDKIGNQCQSATNAVFKVIQHFGTGFDDIIVILAGN
jgi:hypothetical protein